jgi:hypothetical protein
MSLQGKALEDFERWLLRYNRKIFTINDQGINTKFSSLDSTCQNALMIEWLDSIGIFISIHYVTNFIDFKYEYGFLGLVTHKHLTTKFREVSTRKEAIELCLTAANKIYNNENLIPAL